MQHVVKFALLRGMRLIYLKPVCQNSLQKKKNRGSYYSLFLSLHMQTRPDSLQLSPSTRKPINMSTQHQQHHFCLTLTDPTKS